MSSIDPLSTSAAAALDVLLQRRSATRPEVSAALGVTKQTVSLAIGELESRRLAEPVAMQQGALGRSAVRYGVHRSAGWVVGLDLGSSRLRLIAIALDGEVLDDRVVTNPEATALRSWPRQLPRAATALTEMAQRITVQRGALLGVGLAVAHSPEAEGASPGTTRRAEYSAWIDSVAEGVPTEGIVENDVNCEAIAQLHAHPAAVSSILHLHVGVGVGAAFVIDGRLVRGAGGRAGEIRSLPSPLPERGVSAESALGAGGLLAAAGHSPGARLSASINDLFAAAELGDTAAEAAINEEAEGIVDLVLQLTTILDPDLVVLSGQIAGRVDFSRTVIERCGVAGVTASVVMDPLGDAAAARGAGVLARDRVLSTLSGSTR